jgi:hypothetical protein
VPIVCRSQHGRKGVSLGAPLGLSEGEMRPEAILSNHCQMTRLRRAAPLVLSLLAGACQCGLPEVDRACSTEKDCPASAPLCCGTLELGPDVGGTTGSGQCAILRGSSRCAPSCVPSLALYCDESADAVLCSGPAACAAFPGVPRCCTFSNVVGAVTACTNDAGVAAASSCFN